MAGISFVAVDRERQTIGHLATRADAVTFLKSSTSFVGIASKKKMKSSTKWLLYGLRFKKSCTNENSILTDNAIARNEVSPAERWRNINL